MSDYGESKIGKQFKRIARGREEKRVDETSYKAWSYLPSPRPGPGEKAISNNWAEEDR